LKFFSVEVLRADSGARKMSRRFEKMQRVPFAMVALWLSGAAMLPVSPAGAQSGAPAAKKEEKKELPKSGSLSRALSAGSSSQSLPEPWGFEGAESKEKAPITGSVYRAARDKWTMKVFNNSKEDTYATTVEVVQYGPGAKKLKGDSFSFTLRPGQSEQTTLNSVLGSTDASLELRSWKNLTARKAAREEERKAYEEARDARNNKPQASGDSEKKSGAGESRNSSIK
jgi:hypothetical protein